MEGGAALISKNHEKAPICAAFVKEMRAVFGDVKVLYVEENGFVMGVKDDINPDGSAHLEKVEEKRGKAGCDALKAAISEIWEKR